MKISPLKSPKYQEMKFDRTLTYNQHLEVIKNKLKTHKIMAKLAGTSWTHKDSTNNSIRLSVQCH